jgi:ribosomal protein S18 acetylase RimI-like enzyme
MRDSDREDVVDLLWATNMFTHSEVTVAIEQVDIFLTQDNQKDYVVLVVEDENFRVIGMMSFGPAPLTENVFFLYWIAVHPRAQNRGYGRALMLWLEDYAQAAVARMILLETSSMSLYNGTREFYRSLGYKVVSRVPDFYKSGDDRITYAKNLIQKGTRENGTLAEPFKAEL